MERLVEGSLVRLLAGRLHPHQLVAQLARAMEDQAQGRQAPDHYRIYLNPADRDALVAAEPSLARVLSEQIIRLVEEAELELASAPSVDLLARHDLGHQVMEVTAEITGDRGGTTQNLGNKLRRPPGKEPDGRTYLIVGGQRHIPLTQPVYTLGRRLDCDVVLPMPTVSRRHAQLRWRFGRYVLYDLGSTTGTLVNGHPVTEVVLEPGDVFSLGGVDIIYGWDPPEAPADPESQSTRAWPRSDWQRADDGA